MTIELRDHFAGIALQALISTRYRDMEKEDEEGDIPAYAADHAYAFADAMIAARGEVKASDHIFDWAGGDCPVPLDTRVSVWLRDGSGPSTPENAGEWLWERTGGSGDIIAYQVL